jgi:hypothetical protein
LRLDSRTTVIRNGHDDAFTIHRTGKRDGIMCIDKTSIKMSNWQRNHRFMLISQADQSK